MPGHMPYTVEKNAVFQVVEDYLNSDRSHALQTLWDLLDGAVIVDLPPLSSVTLNVSPPPLDTPAGRKQHTREHWFGEYLVGGAWQPQPDFDPVTNATTGFWEYWYGDAEAVFRETLIRALSVALGIPREDPDFTQRNGGAPRPADMQGTQHWPITILWKCPAPFFEGWIEFHKLGSGVRDGHVNVLWSTPAHGVKLFNSPLRPPSGQGADYEVDPIAPAGPDGLWVCAQSFHEKWTPAASTIPSGVAQWSPPVLGAFVHSEGPVVVVSPRIADGGVAVAGVKYVP